MGELIWYPHKGWGFEEGTFEYGDGYWEEFRAKDDTPIGKVLTALRAEFVRKWKAPFPPGGLVDVGIGGGAFLRHMNCQGIDVNRLAYSWLRERGCLWDQKQDAETMTFWDSLEHILKPDFYLSRTRWAFISTPIYKNAEHVIRSKHYKPGEHLWYFTDIGLKRFMAERGFMLKEQNQMEQSCGRVDIGSYAFVRA